MRGDNLTFVGFMPGDLIIGIHPSNAGIRLEIVRGMYLVDGPFDDPESRYRHLSKDQIDKWYVDNTDDIFPGVNDPDMDVFVIINGPQFHFEKTSIGTMLNTYGDRFPRNTDEIFVPKHWEVVDKSSTRGLYINLITGEIESGFISDWMDRSRSCVPYQCFDPALHTNSDENLSPDDIARRCGRDPIVRDDIISRLVNLSHIDLGHLVYRLILTEAEFVEFRGDDILEAEDVLFAAATILMFKESDEIDERKWIIVVRRALSLHSGRVDPSVLTTAYLTTTKNSSIVKARWIKAIMRSHKPSGRHIEDDEVKYRHENGKITREKLNEKLGSVDAYYPLENAVPRKAHTIRAESCIVRNIQYFIHPDDLGSLGDKHVVKTIYENFLLPGSGKRIIAAAQARCWDSLHTVMNYDVLDGKIEHTYKMSEEWIAAMVGTIDVFVDGHQLSVVMNINDLMGELIVVRKPTATDFVMTEAHKQAARNIVVSRLIADGLPMRTFDTFPQFEDCRLFLAADINGKDRLEIWNGVERTRLDLTLRSKFCIHPSLDNVDHILASNNTGRGICVDADKKLELHLSSLSSRAVICLVECLSTIDSTIEYSLDDDDDEEESIEVFWFLCMICAQYPGALKRERLEFHVRSGALMRELAEKITKIAPVKSYPWKLKEREDLPPLWPHQQEAVDILMQGRRRHELLWYDVGSGKTRIVLEYIKRRIEANNMCKYCIWAAPKEAVAQIEREAHRLGFRVSIGFVDYKPKPGTICIKTDEECCMCQMSENEARAICCDDSVFKHTLFVHDEFHKSLDSFGGYLNNSSRSISITGTIIVDHRNTYSWIKYLRRCVSFEVSERNYYVVLGAAIARKLDTHVHVDRQIRRVASGRIVESMIDDAVRYVRDDIGVFLVVRNAKIQKFVESRLKARGVRTLCLEEAVSYEPGDRSDPRGPGYVAAESKLPQVVITTPEYSTGYCMNRYKIMLSCIIKQHRGGETTRQQLEGRINRHNNDARVISVRTYSDPNTERQLNEQETDRMNAAALRDLQREIQE